MVSVSAQVRRNEVWGPLAMVAVRPLLFVEVAPAIDGALNTAVDGGDSWGLCLANVPRISVRPAYSLPMVQDRAGGVSSEARARRRSHTSEGPMPRHAPLPGAFWRYCVS